MSPLHVAAQFVVLVSGIPMEVESVFVDGQSCPKPSLTAVNLMPSSSIPKGVCVGMTYESGRIRYWELKTEGASSSRLRLVGWQTWIAAKDFPKLALGTSARFHFPGTDLSFDSGKRGAHGWTGP